MLFYHYITTQLYSNLFSEHVLFLLSFFKQFKFDKFDGFWIIYNRSLPGPFDPPDNSLPRRNITALSYSWTTCHKQHTTEYLFYVKFWCLRSGSFIENTHIQPITNTILLSICLCQILVPSFRIIHRKYAHSIYHKHHTTEYFWFPCPGSFIENMHKFGYW